MQLLPCLPRRNQVKAGRAAFLPVGHPGRRVASAKTQPFHLLSPRRALTFDLRPLVSAIQGILLIIIGLAALLLLGILLTNRSLRTRWSNRSRFTPREWLNLIVTLLLGVALGHIIYLWLYPGFTLNSRLIIDVVTFFLAALLLICLAMRLPKQN